MAHTKKPSAVKLPSAAAKLAARLRKSKSDVQKISKQIAARKARDKAAAAKRKKKPQTLPSGRVVKSVF